MSTEPHSSEVLPAVVSHGDAHHGPIHTHCENCQTQLQGPYCHACGQHDFEFHRSFRHMFMDALENFFHFEGKFFRNIVVLMFWPGRLTQEFNAGKRVVQMPPFRLYLFVSVLYFFLFFLDQQRMHTAVVFGPTGAAPAAAAEPKEHGNPAPTVQSTAEVPGQVVVEPDDWEWVQRITRRWRTEEARERIGEAFVHSMPRLFLFCLPFFALYSRVLFRKSGQVYLHHLVLALHFHTFVYLWLMFRDGWQFLGGLVHPTVGNLLFRACMAWAIVYPVLMLRRIFQNGWRRTLLKTAVLAGAYGVTLGVSFAAAAVLMFAFA